MTTPLSKRLEELQREYLDKGAVGAEHIFDSPDGEVLLKLLEKKFVFGNLLGVTPEQTAFNLGAREVVLFLRGLREYNRSKNPGQEK